MLILDGETRKTAREAERLQKRKDLLRLLRVKKALRGREDLYFFAKYILGYKDIEEQPHRAMADFWMQENGHKLDLEPRGCFKSTISMAYCIWRIVKNPNVRILLDSEDVQIAKKFLGEIKAQFESNEELRKLYGDFVGKVKWSESEVIVSSRTMLHLKEPTIATSGVETTRVSQHYDLIICDDLHSQSNINTPEQLEKVKMHFKLMFSLLEPPTSRIPGVMIVIGTRWHMGDLYGDIIDREKKRRAMGKRRRFTVRIREAHNDDWSYMHFPTRLTKDYLEDQMIEQGPYVYACQYRNNPVDPSAVKFKPSWVKFYGRYAPKNLMITTTLDPAVSEKDQSCNTANVTVGVDTDNDIYILAVDAVKADPSEVVDLMFHTQHVWHPNQYGVEVVAFQKTFKFYAQERMKHTGQFINFVELKTDTRITKAMRIEALIPYAAAGCIWFPGDGPEALSGGIKQLYQELTQYPMSKTIDCLDALAYQLQLIIPAPLASRKQEPVNTIKQTIERERSKRAKRNKHGRLILGSRNVRHPKQSIYAGAA